MVVWQCKAARFVEYSEDLEISEVVLQCWWHSVVLGKGWGSSCVMWVSFLVGMGQSMGRRVV